MKITETMSSDTGSVVHPDVVQGDGHLLERGRDRSEQDDEEVVDLTEGDLGPDPGAGVGRVPLDVDLAGSAAVGPGQDLERGVATV